MEYIQEPHSIILYVCNFQSLIVYESGLTLPKGGDRCYQ